MMVKEVQRLRPCSNHLKLNLDGSSLGNSSPTGGGGVLQDYGGNLIFGFSKFIGSCSSNKAELQAVIEGLKLCHLLGHMFIDIECDSLVVVSWI